MEKDLLTGLRASSIGLGTEPGRELVGQMYRASGASKLVHRTIQCQRVDAPEAAVVNVYKVDGTLRAERERIKDGKVYLSVEEAHLCEVCKDMEPASSEWKERAACVGDYRGFSEVERERNQFIREVCVKCPVQSECLEYGASNVRSNQGGVWGGVYFSYNLVSLEKKIERKRQELAA